MRVFFPALFLLITALGGGTARPQNVAAPNIDLRTYVAPACEEPDGDIGLRPEEKGAWTTCEKWAWSCIRQGKEANLYAKECANPRPSEEEKARLREPYRFAPFYDPDRLSQRNALRDQFLRTILEVEHYRDQIHPVGIRIYGGYFAEAVNFENITTTINIVLDGSVIKQGIRLTNFATTKNISLDGSNVRGNVLLLRARIDGTLFLQNGVYDAVDTRDARIGSSLDAPGSLFNDELRIDRARIDGKINLAKSRLTLFNAWSAMIGGYVEMRLADIRLQMDMTGATVNGDVRLPRITFGRRVPGSTPRCDWDPQAGVEYVVSDAYGYFAGDAAAQAAVWNEIVASRAGKLSRQEDDVCVASAETKKRFRNNEILLRDMKIGGTLCLIDVTGEIPVAGEQRMTSAATISFDGTQASSTVLRWTDSQSQTLWRAVNFKTGHLLLNLQNSPKRRFIDNMDVGFIALVKADDNGKEPVAGDPDFDKFLCDVTPETKTRDPLEYREAQDRIAEFFKGNESKSAQPFANVVARLESSGVASTYLKQSLSEYRYRDACSQSLFVKEWPRFAAEWQARQELPWGRSWERVRDTWTNVVEKTNASVIDETRKLGLDGLCRLWLPVYKYTTSYGHEPHNLFYFVVGLILVFWLLLKCDTRPASGGVPVPRLGIIYVIDTFIPLPQFRMNRRYANVLPNRPLLRAWLKFHRAAGLILCFSIFVLVFKAA